MALREQDIEWEHRHPTNQGWWRVRNDQRTNLELYSWWNGEVWSHTFSPHEDIPDTLPTYPPGVRLGWCDYWPLNARVPRIDPEGYAKVIDNEEVFPAMKNNRMKCCDCGLVHEINYSVYKVKGVVPAGQVLKPVKGKYQVSITVRRIKG